MEQFTETPKSTGYRIAKSDSNNTDRDVVMLRRTANLVLITFGILGVIDTTDAADVTYAGIAFSGSDAGKESRFPYSVRLLDTLNEQLSSKINSIHPSAYNLTMAKINALADADQAIAVALVITNETVSVEDLGPAYKLFTYVRAQALYFDLKSNSVLRAYPLSFVYLDTLNAPPTDDQKEAAVRVVYYGKDGKPGILSRFEGALANATLPTNASKTVGIASVTLGPEARRSFPSTYGPGESEFWIADQMAEAISHTIGIPVLPYKRGYATGRLQMAINENIFNLDIGEPDYAIDVQVPKMRIVPFDVKPAGRSLIYASYALITVNRPFGGDPYLSAPFKHGVTKLVPASQHEADDFPAYQESITGLFSNFIDAVQGARTPWLKASTDSPNIDKQLISTRAVFEKCK